MLLFPSTMALKFVSDFFSKSCNVLSNNPTGSSFFPCSSVCYYIILISFLADLCLGNICSHMGFFGFTKNICRRRSGHVLSHIRKRFSWWWKCSSKWKKLTLYWPVLECVGEKLLVKKQVSWRTRAPVRFLTKDNRQGNFQVSVASKKYFSFHVVPVYSESDYLILSWWGSGNQGKHFEKVIRDKTFFFRLFNRKWIPTFFQINVQI